MSGNVLLPGCRERVWEPGEDYERHASGLWLPAGEDTVPAAEQQPLGIDLFAGAGTGDSLLADLDLTSDDIGCVFGGPPCQGFSRAGKQQVDDPRNELVFEFMRIVCEIHPRAFCMENVPGMLDWWRACVFLGCALIPWRTIEKLTRRLSQRGR